MGHKHLSLQQWTCCNNICLLHDIARLFGILSLCSQTNMHHVNIPRIKEIKQIKGRRNLKNQKIIRINYLVFIRVFSFLGWRLETIQALFHCCLPFPKKNGQVINFYKSKWTKLMAHFFNKIAHFFLWCHILTSF